jgi:hypothetical protein
VLFRYFYTLDYTIVINNEIGNNYQIQNEKGEIIESHQSDLFFSKKLVCNIDFNIQAALTGQTINDWLGFCFFILSRMEEYQSSKDSHGRFSHSNSFLFQKGVLDRPVIEELTLMFIQKINPEFKVQSNKLEILPTLDIDMTHAVLGRGILRQFLATIKSMIHGTFIERLKILLKIIPDPFHNFDYQNKIFAKHNRNAVYFFLIGDYSKFDKNIHFKNKRFIQTFKQINNHKIGLHPSYYSSDLPEKIALEKQRLEEIIGKEVSASRQHFLRFKLPETYQTLLKNGIQEEHSMGYSEVVGFRAGTGKPFPWYNLNTESETTLVIKPFIVMDVALQHYMQLSSQEAVNAVKIIKEKLRKTGSTFGFCFHNESLSNKKQWKNWRTVFEACLE